MFSFSKSSNTSSVIHYTMNGNGTSLGNVGLGAQQPTQQPSQGAKGPPHAPQGPPHAPQGPPHAPPQATSAAQPPAPPQQSRPPIPGQQRPDPRGQPEGRQLPLDPRMINGQHPVQQQPHPQQRPPGQEGPRYVDKDLRNLKPKLAIKFTKSNILLNSLFCINEIKGAIPEFFSNYFMKKKISFIKQESMFIWTNNLTKLSDKIKMNVYTFSESNSCHIHFCLLTMGDNSNRARGYKTFFMLNSTEHEIFPAHKC